MNDPKEVTEAIILIIEYRYAVKTAAELLRGSAEAIKNGSSEAALWDAAYHRYADQKERLREELRLRGFDWKEGQDPETDWPEVFE